MVGIISSYNAHGSFKGPKFRQGMYYYDQGSGGAVTLGNVITGPTPLYNGSTDRYYTNLNLHERKHFYEQSGLGAYYLPFHIPPVILYWLSNGSARPVFDCMPFITTTYADLGNPGC